MAEARAGQRSVYFVDASHFVLASFLGWVWCFVRLHVRAASGRQRYNVLGALNAVTHELVTEINTTYVNALSVCALLVKIAKQSGSMPITLVMDNARYQRCALVQDSAKALGIELLFLPSYSPNLNLIERLWKFVKKEVLNSRHHQDFKKFSGSHRRLSGRYADEAPRETGDAVDPQFPDVGQCVTPERVKHISGFRPFHAG